MISIHKTSDDDRDSNFGFISKLYVWSVVFETLLFFVLVDQGTSIVGGNLSRLLQFCVISLLILKTFFTPYKNLKLINPFSSYYRWYFFFFFFVLLSFLYGYSNGAYIGRNENFSSNVLRPAFEYFISIYYFLYFAVLPLFLLNSSKGIDYFFRVFFVMFFLSLFLGVIDLLLVAVSGIEFIPRHLSDMRHVGVRFHGIAGEPRDAFVHLFFGLSLLYLRESWTGIKFKKIWVLIIASAALLTQSTSGLIGLCIAAVLIILYQIPKLKIRSLIVLLSLMTVSLSAVAYSVINSDRIQLYLDAAPLALEALERGLELPPIIMYQINNIYPVWIRWLEFTELNLGPLFFGSGLGSTSILNGYILTEGGVLNPHANIIRLVYEGGILGTLLFILAFVRPAQIIEKISNKKNLVYLMLLMLGVTFGHRSSALFTFLGIIITIHIFQSNKEPLKSDSV